MKTLIYGFGNPGNKYQYTRHNLGCLFIKYCLEYFNIKDKFSVDRNRTTEYIEKDNLVFARPLVFYNDIGLSIKNMVTKFDTILMVHDDLKLELGDNRLNHSMPRSDFLGLDKICKVYQRTSHYGNNALRSVFSHNPNLDFMHLRVGIGKVVDDHSSYVLGEFHSSELEEINIFFAKVLDCLNDL